MIISEKEDGMYGYSFASEKGEPRVFQEFFGYYSQIKPKIFEKEDGKWTVKATPEDLAKILSFYDRMVKTGAVNKNELGINGGAQDVGFVEGKYAMVVAGPWMLGYGSDHPNVINDTGIAPLPVISGGKSGTFMEVKPIMINKYSKNKDLAWKLVKFLTSSRAIALENRVEGANPPRKDVAKMDFFNNNSWQKEFVPQLNNGVVPSVINWELPRRNIVEAVQNVIDFIKRKPDGLALGMNFNIFNAI